jgi:hypothetical protein
MRRRFALGMLAAGTTLVVAGVAAAAATPGALSDADVWTGISFAFIVFAFSGVGAVIALRLPANPIGWLLNLIGLLFAVVIASSLGARWALQTGSLTKTLGEWIDVPSSAWVIALSLIGTQLPLRLPDGRLPSPRWRWFSRVTLALIAVSLVGMMVQPGRVESVAGTANPIGSESLKPLTGAFFLVILSFIGGIAALVARYRRSSAHDRVQLRWVAFGGGVFLAVYLVTFPLNSSLSEDSAAAHAVLFVTQAGFAALPISIGYAVLRHNLYDIDVVINRALVYGGLTATLAAAYVGSVLLLQLVLSPSSDLAIAASTLAVAALFRPARTRIQGLVDRRFYRRKYDAQRTLESFAARLRDEVALDALSTELRGVVAETMQPAHLSLWVRS